MNGAAVIALLIFLAACAAAATPGLLLRPGTWYRDLIKPAWRPPDWLFGPVWALLYISIAVSGWLVWQRAETEGAPLALAVYALQLVLNGLWSVILFGLRRPDLAFLEVLCLWLSIVATIAAFALVDGWAAVLLIPYALWVGFAALLNFRIWRLNPARPSS